MTFFAKSQLISAAPAPTEPRCGACGLHRTCGSPKMAATGQFMRNMVVIGEAPGGDEDAQGQPFVGEAGQLLAQLFDVNGANLRRDCLLSNSLICRPPQSRTPTDEEVTNCRPQVVNLLKYNKPTVVLLLGQVAIKSVIGHCLGSAPGAARMWVGERIPYQKANCWIVPTWHPAATLHEDHPVYRLELERGVREALRLSNLGRPWTQAPNWEAEVQKLFSIDQAAYIMKKWWEAGGPVAFDFESNSIKPDDSRCALATCAVCWRGQETIAFPWLGRAADAALRLFYSDKTPLIAHNLKHEDRWLRKVGGRPGARWIWCTMNSAHIANNKEGVTGLKHQAFSVLGFGPYNDKVAGLFGAKGKILTIPQMLKRIAMEDLLQYNGLDALLTYKLAERQMEHAGLSHLLEV